MRALLRIITAVLEVLFDGAAFVARELFALAVLMFRTEPPKKPTYDSRFENHPDVSRWNKGFSVTGTAFLTVEASTRSAIVSSPSGGGKTSTILLPTACRLMASGHGMIINDPAKQVYEKISGAREGAVRNHPPGLRRPVRLGRLQSPAPG